jgi:hypothetical protein
MIFDLFIGPSVKLGEVSYRLLEQYVLNQLINFGKGFEQAVILLAVTAFLLITIGILIKHVKKLPKYYVIETVDLYGRNIIPHGLRLTFRTYDAATSYLQFYQSLYGRQYQFRVTGLRINDNTQL